MRATLPSRFALALDARAPRRSLNGAAAAATATAAAATAAASVTTSGPIGQALLEKARARGREGQVFSLWVWIRPM